MKKIVISMLVLTMTFSAMQYCYASEYEKTFSQISNVNIEDVAKVKIRSGMTGENVESASSEIVYDVFSTLYNSKYFVDNEEKNSGGWRYSVTLLSENEEVVFEYTINSGTKNDIGTYKIDTPETLCTILEKYFYRLSEWDNPYNDIKDTTWYYNSVKEMCLRGVLNGIDENTFAPNKYVTRGMFVTALYRLNGEQKKTNPTFIDVPDDAYYADSVAWAEQNGIVSGVSETEFAPDAKITREQLVTILYRYAKIKGYDLSFNNELTDFLLDTDEISEFAIIPMKWAISKNIIIGTDNKELNSHNYSTRAEMSLILARFIDIS